MQDCGPPGAPDSVRSCLRAVFATGNTSFPNCLNMTPVFAMRVYLAMWIPLGDCPRERGGLAYLEGSHHWVMAGEREGTLKMPAASITAGLPGLADERDARWLVTDHEVGDVVVHSAHVVHAALDNTDRQGTMRLSTDIRYQWLSEPIDWRWQEHWNYDDGL